MMLDRQIDFFLLIKDPEEYPETFTQKQPQRKSVEDVQKSKTKEGKLMTQTQGNSTGDAIILSQGRFQYTNAFIKLFADETSLLIFNDANVIFY